MRHLAWLHAVPEGSKKSRLKAFSEDNEDSNFLKLPDAKGAEYLVNYLHEAGLFKATGMGVVPIDWSDIESWLRCTELELTIWEKLTIKEMSEVYVGEYNQASDKHREAPYLFVDEEAAALNERRKTVENKLKSVFSSFKRSSKQ